MQVIVIRLLHFDMLYGRNQFAVLKFSEAFLPAILVVTAGLNVSVHFCA